MQQSTNTNDGPVILIVEDSRAISSELQRSIEERVGFKVESVSTLAGAREFLNRPAEEVFLAILDLNLPDSTDGEIVDLACSMAIPSIVFTADINETTRKRMLSKDVIDYVVKDTHAVENILGYVSRLIRNKKTRVLVVEDSKSFRFSLCAMLQKQMFQVIDVADAETALQVMESDEISLVIVDYELPGMDGVELTKKLRKKFSKDVLAIIGLSVQDDAMLRVQFIKNGSNDFIAKPFEVEEFYCRVDHNIETLECIRALKAANTVKNQFLGMAVHDLRSPINGINGLTEMLLDDLCGELNGEQRELIEFIHGANLHMNSMVSDLLDISVIEAGKLRLLKCEADFRVCIEQRLRIHGIGAKKKSITLDFFLDDIRQFAFDARRIEQVLDNLLTNALKFSPTGESIEIILMEKDGQAQVCIRDYGQGVPPGEEKLLFQSFKKTSVQPTAGESGTGLGLPIVKKIVEAHGGQVWVESEYGKGASFFFALPL